MQDNQQAYDRGMSIFSPDGRLYQVEYAREGIKRGTASVGGFDDSSASRFGGTAAQFVR